MGRVANSRLPKTAQDAALNVGQLALTLLVNVVATPIIVGSLGAAGYGLLTALWTCLSWVVLLEAGLGPTLVLDVSRGARENLSEAVGAALRIALLVGLACGAIATIISVAGSKAIAESFHVPPAWSNEFGDGIRTIMIGAPFLAYATVMTSVSMGTRSFTIHALAAFATGGGSTALAAVIASLGGSLSDVAMATTVGAVAAAVVHTIYAARLTSVNDVLKGNVNTGFVRRWKHFFGARAASYVTGQVTDRSIIGLAGGSGSLAYYSIPASLVQAANSLVARAAEVVYPAASQYFAAKDVRDTSLVESAIALGAVLAGVVLGPLAGVDADLLRVWVGSDIAAGASGIVAQLCGGYFLIALTMVPAHLANARGRTRVTSAFQIAVALVDLVLLLVLIPYVGVKAASLAMLLTGVIVVPPSLARLHAALESSSVTRTILRTNAAGMCAFLGAASTARLVCSLWRVEHLAAVLVTMVVSMSVAVCLGIVCDPTHAVTRVLRLELRRGQG